MNKALLSAALAGVFAAGLAFNAQAADEKAPAEKEKCYGIAKTGKNDCKNVSGSHACAGHATKDNDAGDWVYAEKGKCAEQGGTTEPKK
jgi:uncharacterized membrane protein